MKDLYLRMIKIGSLPFLKLFGRVLIIGIFLMAGLKNYTNAQTDTIPSGAFIIDMGQEPQTYQNSLKPYGMIYDLIVNFGVPIDWIIDTLKIKDGPDFTYDGILYKGGPFIVPAIHRTTDVNNRITYWQSQGVVGVTTTSLIVVPVFKQFTVSTAPRWTLDSQNGAIAADYFVNAGIPESAHGGDQSNWKYPSELDECDDIFVMPHADPNWAVHANLLAWNRDHRGAIWNACHSGSALELMFNPSNPSEQTNFLTIKTGVAGGGGPYAFPDNSLIHWNSHDDGTPPYTYRDHGDPIMQFIGVLDGAVQNGSEQIYIPVQSASGGWRPTTVVGVFDPDHPESTMAGYSYDAAVIAYGHAYGDTTRGLVMYESAHKHHKTSQPDNVAAQRAFFNFSFLAGKQKAPDPEVQVNITDIYSGMPKVLTFILAGERNISEFSVTWSSSCGGSFSVLDEVTTTFTAPIVASATNCVITITLVDACLREYKASFGFSILCDITIVTAVNNPCYDTPSGGEIAMTITQAGGPYLWNWSKDGGASTDSGTGVTITGLSAGDYDVTVVSGNGAGCAGPFSATLTLSPEITNTISATAVTCPSGSDGAIDVTVSGGSPPFTYLWNDAATTISRSGIAAGTYTLTATDSNGCDITPSETVTQPDAIVVTPVVTDVTCNGFSTGEIDISVTGGTSGYTYLWADGPTTQDRTGLAGVSYSVTVTDSENCTQAQTGIAVANPTAISASASASAILCNGGTSTITVTASGGTGTLQYSLNGGTYQTSNEFTGVSASASAYIITVKDANDCTTNTSVTVSEPNPMDLSAVLTPETCATDNDGAIDLTVAGGDPGYTYLWGDGPTTQDRTGISSGVYSVTVTDSQSCTANTSVTVTIANPEPVTPGSIEH